MTEHAEPCREDLGGTRQARLPGRAAIVAVAERYALLWLLVALIVFFSIYPSTTDTFLTVANLRNLAADQSVIAIAALAALVPLVCGQFDVSIGAVLGMASFAVAEMLHHTGLPLAIVIVLGVGLGGLVGLLNGLIIAYVRANSFIITLGMATFVGGLVSLASNDQTIVGVPDAMTRFGSANWIGVPRPVWLTLFIGLGAAYVLRHTIYGRRVVSIGANPRAARLVGIQVNRLVASAFVLAGLLAGVAGALQLARSGATNPQIGPGFTLSALAAAFLGSTTIRPGQFNVPGTIVGVFFVAVSVNGLTLAGAASWVDPVFNGAAVVIAVSLSTLLANRRGALQGAD
jgi:ribose transport system permease protein